jgi:predicted NBD/HSP70 family sugar kinase
MWSSSISVPVSAPGSSLAAVDRRSDYLAAIVAQGRQITLSDVRDAMNHGDRVARELMTTSAQMVGETLALIVNFFNASLIVIAGSVPDNGDS